MFIHIILFVVSAAVRLPFLNSYPPGGPSSFNLRLLSAISGIISILLFNYLVSKITQNTRFAFLSGLILTLMPWHIEQSRVVSPIMLITTILLAEIAFWLNTKRKLTKLFSLVFIGILSYLIYPHFWLFSKPIFTSNIKSALMNMNRLASVEFLFYKNESYWEAGLRTIGVLVPSLIPFFIIGVITILKKISIKHWRYIVPIIVLWILAGLNPKFPEGREFFLATPLFALIVATGLDKVYTKINYMRFLYKIMVIPVFFLIIYDYVLFFHYYTHHYRLRVQNEIPYEKRNF